MPDRIYLLVALGVLIAFFGQSSTALSKANEGVSGVWAAFSDKKPRRCYAITAAQNVALGQQDGEQAYFTVGIWPERAAATQVHIRLSSARKPGTPLRLSLNGMRFDLVSAGYNAWAPDAAGDAAIIRALRSGAGRAVVQGTGRNGRVIRDVYSLDGAATAIDAARLACVPIRQNVNR